MAVEVGDRRIEVVRDEGAAGATRVLVVDPVPEAEHEVVDEQLRAAVEELGKRLRPLVGLEDVLLLDRNPRQIPAPAGELIALAHIRLLGIEQLTPFGEPFVSCPFAVVRHGQSPSLSYQASLI